jgi:hypothetical protein
MSLDRFRESQERYSTQLTAFAPAWPALDSDPPDLAAKNDVGGGRSQHLVDRDDWYLVDPDKALPWTSKRKCRNPVSPFWCERLHVFPCFLFARSSDRAGTTSVLLSSLVTTLENGGIPMLAKILAISLLSLGLATSAMAQSSGGSGSGGSGTGGSGGSSGSGTSQGAGGNSSGSDNGSQNSGDNGAASGKSSDSQNKGDNNRANAKGSRNSGGDSNDCQRRTAGGTDNPSTNNQTSSMDSATACN